MNGRTAVSEALAERGGRHQPARHGPGGGRPRGAGQVNEGRVPRGSADGYDEVSA